MITPRSLSTTRFTAITGRLDDASGRCRARNHVMEIWNAKNNAFAARGRAGGKTKEGQIVVTENWISRSVGRSVGVRRVARTTVGGRTRTMGHARSHPFSSLLSCLPTQE